MGRKFKIYKKNKKEKKKSEPSKRIIGQLPGKVPIYGSKSYKKYDYMGLSPLEKKINKLNNLKKKELEKFPVYDIDNNLFSPISKNVENYNNFYDSE